MKNTNSKSLIEELNFKNSELLKQNKELKSSIVKAEKESDKLNFFYNRSLSGYLVLDENLKISSLNLTSSKLLKKHYSEIINTDIFSFVLDDYQTTFKAFLDNAKVSLQKEYCKIKLISNTLSKKYFGIIVLYHPESESYYLEIKNDLTKFYFNSLNEENNFLFNETERLGFLGTCKINISKNHCEISKALSSIFGIKTTATPNFDYWLSIIHPEDRVAIKIFFKDQIKHTTTFNKKFRIIRQSDKEVRWIESRGEFSFFGIAKEIVLSGIVQDITESKLITEKMQLAEIRSNSIFKSSKEGILMLDGITGQITDVNPFLIALIGFDYQELVGKELWEIGTFKNIAASKEAFIELQNKEYIRFENMPLETKNGKSIDVEFVSNVYLVEQKKVILCHIRDISDRKKIDEALKITSQLYFAMFEKNQAVQLLIDPLDGRIIDANTAAALFYGYSLEQFKSMNLSDISTFPAERIIEELGKFGLTGQSYFQFVHKLASGEKCDIEIYTSPLLQNGKQYLISTINNITMRKLEEERLTQLNQQLNQVNALKSQFISTVSHEFRTPLAGILSSVQLLKIYSDSWNTEKKDKMYKQIFDAVQHTKALLDDVSLIDEEQNSKSFFRPSAIELSPLMNEIISENLSISGTNHSINFRNLTTLKTCYMDAVMIRHIFNNILSNAIKYSDESKVITFDIHQINNQKIKFEIQDQGIGIPAEEIAYLIEPFYRASNIGTISGTGFGMSIVKRFVELHNGELQIESEIHKGTKVTVILPYN